MKRLFATALVLAFVLPLLVMPASAFTFDPGGGSGSTYVVNNTTGIYKLNWHFTDFGGKTRYTWMTIKIHALTLEYYDYPSGGGSFVKWKMSFSFDWDTDWLSGLWGEPKIRWGDDSLRDCWAHTYDLGTGELLRGRVKTVSGSIWEPYTSWTTPYAHFYLSTNCGQTGYWYTFGLWFKIPTESSYWSMYHADYQAENWAFYLGLGLKVT
ncbi:hypothetical protein EU538_07460 [Candidatus Thorarchaeota archaeon]|nr:MAG: hypothetical protein EU538_07460 [Candidatus Thorarchaeota archaeon]